MMFNSFDYLIINFNTSAVNVLIKPIDEAFYKV